jgi:hypothetical protein
MGDVVLFTQFLSREEDLLLLPTEPVEIPRIPLNSMSYRIGTLLNANGEKTTKEHLFYALRQTIQHWKKEGIHVELCDFTSFAKLDEFPVHHVIFFELINDEEHKINDEQHLCKANSI